MSMNVTKIDNIKNSVCGFSYYNNPTPTPHPPPADKSIIYKDIQLMKSLTNIHCQHSYAFSCFKVYG